MSKKVLVAFASKYGATAEIAEKIGGVISQAGFQVDVISVGRVRDIKAYGAVILGSAVYIGKWPKEAEAFLKTCEKSLAGQPVVDRIHPRDIAVFHGFINPEKINFIETFAIKNIVKKPFGDFRDWNMIVTWANMVVSEIKDAVRAS